MWEIIWILYCAGFGGFMVYAPSDKLYWDEVEKACRERLYNNAQTRQAHLVSFVFYGMFWPIIFGAWILDFLWSLKK